MTPRLAVSAAGLVATLAAAACTRPRHGGALPPTPTAAVRAAATQSAAGAAGDPSPGAAAAATTDPATHLRIDAPAAGARLTSPVRVRGTARQEDGLLYVAQVVVAGAKPVQRGNARLSPDADGGFSVDVPYTLDVPSDGTVEVSAVDPVSGTVAETVRVTVRLAAAR